MPMVPTNTVSVFYRDYKTVGGLQIPLIVKNGANKTRTEEKLVIDRVQVNPHLEPRIFVKPYISGWHSASTIDIGSTRPVRPLQCDHGTAMPTGYKQLSTASVPGPGGTPQCESRSTRKRKATANLFFCAGLPETRRVCYFAVLVYQRATQTLIRQQMRVKLYFRQGVLG